MNIESNMKNFNPDYFRKVSESKIEKRDKHPVDFNCMHTDYCKKHPVDVLFRAIEKAANDGKKEYRFGRVDVFNNLVDEVREAKNVTVPYKETVKKFFKTKEVEKTKVVDENEKLRRTIIFDTLDELELILWNKGFNYNAYRSELKSDFGHIIYFDIFW